MGPILVLGGGQLGLMMAEAAARYGIAVDRYDPEGDRLLPGTSDLGVPATTDTLARYARITVEREAFPDTGPGRELAESERCVARGALAVIPDRFTQKSMLDDLGIATAPWRPLDQEGDLGKALSEWGPVVVKARSGGYDGRGMWFADEDGADVPEAAIAGKAIIEKKIPFSRELSVVGARNPAGEMVFYPLVRNWHVNGILCLTLAPAAAVDAALQAEAETALGQIMTRLDYAGVMAVEFFQHGEHLLVNEIAPRVHNSGHWSQEGADISQFELHVRALADLPLATPQSGPFNAMVNLIGVDFRDDWLSRAGTVHWYGKSVRPGRKVGHVNLVAGSAEDLHAQLSDWLDVMPDGALAQLDDELNSSR
ncbi:MAG: ATP-grasp domain-containing protein [Alcanivoracaceae bacterium]